MKLLTYMYKGNEKIGYLSENEKKVIPFESIGISCKTMNELIDELSLKELLERVRTANSSGLEEKAENGINLEDVELLSPIPRPKQDIICLGINYAAHAEESARYKKEAFVREKVYPIYFSKRVNEAIANGKPVDAHRDMFENLDYEAELAVIIGKKDENIGDCTNVSKDEVQNHIFGYTIVNDISAREIQTRHKQWYFGKSLDGFTPMGPWIVTADEISYPPELGIRSYVNGELRQNSNTNLLINDIDYIICELTRGMTLLSGTIISTGTPAGVGMGLEPPEFMKPGDVVVCEIDKIGKLTNPIK